MIRLESTEDPTGFGSWGEASRMWMGGLLDTGGDVGDGFVGLAGEKDGCLCSRARAVESPKTPAPTMSMGSRWASHMSSHVSKIGRRDDDDDAALFQECTASPPSIPTSSAPPLLSHLKIYRGGSTCLARKIQPTRVL
jgi:hypothetical protein